MIQNAKHLACSFIFAALLIGASQVHAQSVNIMAYNVENLFDTQQDAGKDDWTYLPLSTKKTLPGHREVCSRITNPNYKRDCLHMDWSAKVLQTKVQNLASVISTSFDGKGPDILVLGEIENMAALQELQRTGLRNKGYTEIILIEGPDVRGIDVAILSRLPLVATRDHVVELKTNGGDARPTRNILEATFQVGSKKVTVFANHWPSQGNATAHRIVAANTLTKAALAADARGEAVVALGDFNSLLPEINGPVGEVLNRNFVDGIEMRMGEGMSPTQFPGSHWYKGSWSFLDRAYVLKNSTRLRGMKVDWSTLDVHAPEFALRVNEYRRRDGSIERTFIPYRFNVSQAGGYSDHLPLVMTVSF